MYLIIGNRLNWNFNEMFAFDLLSFGFALEVFIYFVHSFFIITMKMKSAHELLINIYIADIVVN